VELWWNSILGDVFVVWWERVALEAEGAYPEASSHVDLTAHILASVFPQECRHELPEWIENTTAWSLARYRLILQERCIRLLLQWGIQGTNWDYESIVRDVV
jgi:hypothetical protein